MKGWEVGTGGSSRGEWGRVGNKCAVTAERDLVQLRGRMYAYVRLYPHLRGHAYHGFTRKLTVCRGCDATPKATGLVRCRVRCRRQARGIKAA